MLFESRGDGSEMLELVEEAFDPVAIAIEVGAEWRNIDAVGHWPDVGPCPSIGETLRKASLS